MENQTPITIHKWHRTPLALAAFLSLILILTGLFFSVAHGSLARIYVAKTAIHASVSQPELEQKISAAAKSYKLKVKYSGGTIRGFPLAATGVTVDAKASAANAKRVISRSTLRRLEWWRPIEVNLVTKTDMKALDSFVGNGATQVKVASVDAALTLAGGTVIITPEKLGSGNALANPNKTIVNAVASSRTDPLALKPMVLPVAITAKDLIASKDKAQALVNKPVTFTIAGHAVTAGPADIAGWVELTAVPESKTVDVTVNSGKILDYINIVARRYITPPHSRLITSTPEGQVILDYGSDGVDVVNKDQTAADVAQKLLHDKELNIALAVQYTPANTVETQAYDKWFVADVTTKRMYAYEGTNLTRSFLISAGAPATPTVVGQFAVYRKYVSQDMTGNNADGSRYFQPAVPYVNYFTGAYAIHGNYWRPTSYFGNTNSSHGCIGVMVADAAWIYDWAPVGTHVIVHK